MPKIKSTMKGVCENMQLKTERIFFMFFLLFMTVYPFLIFPVESLYYVTPDKLVYLTLFTIALWCIWILQWWKKEQPLGLLQTKGEKVVFLYLGIVVLSTIFSYDPKLSFFGGYYKFQGFIAWFNYTSLFLFAYHLIAVHNQLKIIRFMVFASFFVGVYGIIQHFFVEYLVGKQAKTKFVMSWGFFDNPNHFGTYLVLMMIFSMTLYLLATNQRERWIQGIITCILFLSLLYTLSRASWIATFCGIFILTAAVVWKRRYLWKSWGLLLLSLFLLLQIANITENNFFFSRVASISEQENTGSGRLWIWKTSLPLIKDYYLIGSGPSTFSEVFPATGEEKKKYTGSKELDNSHNEYLEIAITTGIPALIAYLSFIIIVLKSCFSAVRQFDEDRKIFAYGLMAAVVGYLIKVLFNISVVTVAPFFWVLLGMCYAFSVRKDEDPLSQP